MSNRKPDRDDRDTQPDNQEDQNVNDQPASNEDDDDDWGSADVSDAAETDDDETDDDVERYADRDDTARLPHRGTTAELSGDQPDFDELLIMTLKRKGGKGNSRGR